MSDPKISVISTVYNIESWLRRGVDSVLKQQYADFELILVDDGSTDGSAKICDEYSRKDARVRTIHRKNGGVAAARNDGLRIARGEYIAYFDPDDWIESEYLSTLLDLCERNSCKISVCNVYNHYENGRSDGNSYLKDGRIPVDEFLGLIVSHATFGVWDKLWRRDVLDGFSFDETLMAGEDLDIYKVYYRIDYVAATTKQLYHYCNRPSSVSHQVSLRNRVDRLRSVDTMIEDLKVNRPQWLPAAYCLSVRTRRNFISVGLYNNFPNELLKKAFERICDEAELAWPITTGKTRRNLLCIRYFPHLWFWWKKLISSIIRKGGRREKHEVYF